MRLVVLAVCFLLLVFSLAFAQNDLEVLPEHSPYPGGSPFPPGGEPSLTHRVKIFWITEGKIDTTKISLFAKGKRPTQSECYKIMDGKEVPCEGLYAGIAPDCDYQLTISNSAVVYQDKKEAAQVVRMNGAGVFEVRVYGFLETDFKEAPVVKANYYSKHKLAGETSVLVTKGE